jgi:plastocyanin
MKRRLSVSGAALALALATLALPGSASAGSFLVDVEDDVFSPSTLNAEVGVPVHWIAGGTINDHNVVQDKKLFDSGAATTSFDFLRHPSAGTFPYYCELHGNKGGLGMSGKLRVPPDFISLKGGNVFGLAWATKDTNTGNQFDVQYRVEDGKWKYWKKNTSMHEGVFGNNDKPVNVRPGKNYKIRARSEKASNPKKKHSGWSPVVSFGVV